MMLDIFKVFLANTFLIALAICVGFVFFLKPVAKKYCLFDVPNGRKAHDAPVLVMGGIAMTFSFILVALSFLKVEHHVYHLLLALFVICAVGVYDDFRPVSARFHFLTQFIAILILVVGDQGTVQTLGDLFGLGEIHTGWIAIPFTAICIMGVINAINMIDGVDGLAGAVTLVSIFWFGLIAFFTEQFHLLDLLWIQAGILVGFLFFNMRFLGKNRASIFMGNAGSMTLGLLLCWFAIQLCGRETSPLNPILGVWIIAFPLMDMFSVMLRRVLNGHSPFVGDRTHMHHLLTDMGYRVPTVVLIEMALSFLLGGLAFIAWWLQVHDSVMLLAFLILLGLHCMATHKLRSRTLQLSKL